ncbi:hypothetical protein V6O07_23750 [Arthrospira platensis SPKY2]|uniref:vWA-MoxR associated protein N-terminal HTH domain-containing protein n=1 Tax=Limnospira indica PCC 8005 TaxID=376219 RepID=A0A9P1KKK9_9CYAN|nr:hypothetical protein [Limnospira indica]CDM97329.1 conserved hypothetical protein [Limnospira indica PCC 8005]
MNIEETLLFADQVFYSNTGQHLDDVQIGLIKGVLMRQKYTDIAQELNCTEAYIKNVGYELWKLLSEIFQEEVNKSNLQSTLLRHRFINSFNFNIFGNIDQNNVIGSLQFCSPRHESMEFLRGKQQAKAELVVRLREIGMSDVQISECLNMSLEDVRKIGLVEE